VKEENEKEVGGWKKGVGPMRKGRRRGWGGGNCLRDSFVFYVKFKKW